MVEFASLHRTNGKVIRPNQAASCAHRARRSAGELEHRLFRWPTSLFSAAQQLLSKPLPRPAGLRRHRCGQYRAVAMPPKSRPISSLLRGSSRWLMASATTWARDASHVAEHLLVDRAQLLDLGAPEMTALIGGLRVLGVSTDDHGVLTENVSAQLSERLLRQPARSSSTEWSDSVQALRVCSMARTAIVELVKLKWTGTRNDLAFGSNSILACDC